MTEKLVINDLPTNLIAVIFQFLPEKDMFMAGFTCQKFHEALQKDFLMEELVKRDIMFLPEDESRGESWKEIHEFIKKYRKADRVVNQINLIKAFLIVDIKHLLKLFVL